jgi:hypothetical protein
MNRIGVLGIFTLICTGAACAQQPTVTTQLGPAKQANPRSEPASVTQQQYVIPINRCPIGMHVMQGSGMQMLRADDGKVNQLLTPSLTLAPKDHRDLAKATVTARGYAVQHGTLDLVARKMIPDHPAPKQKELEKTLTVNLSPDGADNFSAELQLPGFGILNTVELNAVTYTDGSVWKVSSADDCRIAPDPLLLIAAH